jgi:hypothetical protein
MAKSTHKGSELNNVQETWEQNERARAAGKDMVPASEPAGDSELEKVIHEEAAEYDNDKKEDRLLGGDRATVNDDDGAGRP